MYQAPNLELEEKIHFPLVQNKTVSRHPTGWESKGQPNASKGNAKQEINIWILLQ